MPKEMVIELIYTQGLHNYRVILLLHMTVVGSSRENGYTQNREGSGEDCFSCMLSL